MIKLKRLVAFLLCVIMLLSFCSCEYIDRILGTEQESPADDSQEHGKEEEGEKENVTDSTPEDDEDLSDKDNTIEDNGIVLDNDSDIIVAIIDHLYWRSVDVDLVPNSLGGKIRDIRNGKLPLYVKFDPSVYYYVCGYCKEDHRHDRCFKDDGYIWVMYNSPDRIRERFGDAVITKAFQFNNALSVTNLLGDTDVPEIDHFFSYTTEFDQGFNVNPAESFDESFITLSFTQQSAGTKCYCSSESPFHHVRSIRTVELDGELYIAVLVSVTILSDASLLKHIEEINEEDCGGLGIEYHKVLLDLIQYGKYIVTIVDEGSGKPYIYTYNYGLIAIDDYMNIVKSGE